LLGLHGKYHKIEIMSSLLAGIGEAGVKKVHKMTFGVDISEQFIVCMDKQLTEDFEKQTGIIVKHPIWMGWGQEYGFEYLKNKTSSINCQIRLKYGTVTPTILWKSHSGRIYEISDTNIDCNDIVFWFDDLDARKANAIFKPKWTLLTLDVMGDYFKKGFKNYGVNFSNEYLQCADNQLTPMFIKQTGIKLKGDIGLFEPNHRDIIVNPDNTITEGPYKPILEVNKTSTLIIVVCINAYHNKAKIAWKSKSGKIYKTTDTDIDYTDIEFWFEELQPELYLEQYYPKGQKLPFSTKGLPFEVVVTNLNIDCNLWIEFENGHTQNLDKIIEEIGNFIGDYNDKSELKDRADGVVHNGYGNKENENNILFEIDLGSVGFSFFKKLFKKISTFKEIKKLEIA
jgi:hypothetical protein